MNDPTGADPAVQWRRDRAEKFGECWICQHSPKSPWRDKPRELSQICVHEIACGTHRQKALDKAFATLVLCWWCNGYVVVDKSVWPEARQLALLLREAPEDFDLAAYNALVNPRAPNRITLEEVHAYRLN